MMAATSKAIQSLPALNRPDGTAMSPDSLPGKLLGKRVALYFAAGWCPMCTSFEPSLMAFIEKSKSISGGIGDIEVIYVPSDKSVDDIVRRTLAMGMMSVPFGENADAIKSQYKIWAGIESSRLGSDRRSGVPSLVVLDSIDGNELAFLPTESMGAKALQLWPLEDTNGVW
ncbi:hypothetical protein ACHAXA_000603 [Cyclostephanos tholiformis]|uniref:Thioredoxin-like fold domain-containing protein n=1 Tax=Cyclostephanos tholiformis TaxID=382380 RepID=A0ABD3SRA6_9STRA